MRKQPTLGTWNTSAPLSIRPFLWISPPGNTPWWKFGPILYLSYQIALYSTRPLQTNFSSSPAWFKRPRCSSSLSAHLWRIFGYVFQRRMGIKNLLASSPSKNGAKWALASSSFSLRMFGAFALQPVCLCGGWQSYFITGSATRME